MATLLQNNFSVKSEDIADHAISTNKLGHKLENLTAGKIQVYVEYIEPFAV